LISLLKRLAIHDDVLVNRQLSRFPPAGLKGRRSMLTSMKARPLSRRKESWVHPWISHSSIRALALA